MTKPAVRQKASDEQIIRFADMFTAMGTEPGCVSCGCCYPHTPTEWW